MRLVTFFASVGIACLILLAVYMIAGAKPAIEAIARPDPAAFDAELVARGAELAAIGNCSSCHTAAGNAPFAGGYAMQTPFGTIYSTNITPDEDTGIGRWSEDAFIRSMRKGIDRDGRHLYPAFPYNHLTLVTDADNRALYAFLMTRRAVRYEPPPNELPFPLGFRALIAGWKLLYFDEGIYRPDPARDVVWNHGAYLSEGLAHCGACHTPRNRLGAPIEDRHWAGGVASGWTAYAIDEASPAPIPWDKDAMTFYLAHGWHEAHGVSRGPMAEVTANLGRVPAEDVAAIAAYTVDVMGEPTPERQAAADRLADFVARERGVGQSTDTQGLLQAEGSGPGADLYAAACASCHDSGRPQPYGGLSFHLSTAVHADSPQNIINVTLFGLPPRDGVRSAVMPAYGDVLSDEEMAAVLEHMRATYTDRAPWEGLVEMVRETRARGGEIDVMPTDGLERPPVRLVAED